MQKQFSNAMEKLERAQRHAEDKRVANQQTIERLQREYEEMSTERRQNDKEVEELKGEADEVATKVRVYVILFSHNWTCHFTRCLNTSRRVRPSSASYWRSIGA